MALRHLVQIARSTLRPQHAIGRSSEKIRRSVSPTAPPPKPAKPWHGCSRNWHKPPCSTPDDCLAMALSAGVVQKLPQRDTATNPATRRPSTAPSHSHGRPARRAPLNGVAPPTPSARRQALVPKTKRPAVQAVFLEHADGLRAHNQHRNVRSLQNALRNAAQHQFFQPSAAVRAHHNQVSPQRFLPTRTTPS